MGIIGTIIDSAAKGFFGEAAKKLVSYIPSGDEHRRNKIDKLQKEQNELKNEPESGKRDKRLADIASELGRLYTEAKNK